MAMSTLRKSLVAFATSAAVLTSACGVSATANTSNLQEMAQISPAGGSAYDYNDNKIEDLSELEQAIYRVNVDHTYRVDGTAVDIHARGLGSAVGLSKDDPRGVFLLTNDHVVSPDPAEEVLSAYYFQIMQKLAREGVKAPENITLSYVSSKLEADLRLEKGVKYTTKVEAITSMEDLALLRVSVPEKNRKDVDVVSTIGRSEQLRVGNLLYISGFGAGQHLVSRGIYSGQEPNGVAGSSQIDYGDTHTIPGHSGGGVFAIRDGQPELVGITRVSLARAYGGFIPVSTVKNWMNNVGESKLLSR